MIFHYVRYDEPGANGRLARAVCGQLVNPKREHAAEPSCPRCAQWLREYEAMRIADDETEVNHAS